MATNSYSLRTLYHHSHSLSRHRRHSVDCLRPSPSSPPPPLLFLKPTNSNNVSPSLSSSFSPFPIISSSSSSSSTPAAATVAPSTSTAQPISFDVLEQHLTEKNFLQADDETRRLLIALAGEAPVKRGYVFFSEVQYIQESDLRAIDSLWRKHSDNKFGYSVQKRLWEKSNRDFTKFFIRVGWMKKLDTEIEQYNYRSFPTEFIWELNAETPEGHLPLTNALRGTQLFQNILLHPAFDDDGDDDDDDDSEEGRRSQGTAAGAGNGSNVSSLSNRIFKTDYSF